LVIEASRKRMVHPFQPLLGDRGPGLVGEQIDEESVHAGKKSLSQAPY